MVRSELGSRHGWQNGALPIACEEWLVSLRQEESPTPHIQGLVLGEVVWMDCANQTEIGRFRIVKYITAWNLGKQIR